MARHRSVPLLVALALVALIGPLVGPAAAVIPTGDATPASLTRDEAREHALASFAQRLDGLRAAAASPSPAGFLDVGTFTDPESDTVAVLLDADGAQTLTARAAPSADLVEYAASYGATELSFFASVAAPRNLLDPASEELTEVSWLVAGTDGEELLGIADLLSVGGRSFAFFVALPAELEADETVDPAELLVCEGVGAQTEGGAYAAVRFPAGCALDATSIRIATQTTVLDIAALAASSEDQGSAQAGGDGAQQAGPQETGLVLDVAPDADLSTPNATPALSAPIARDAIPVARRDGLRLSGPDRFSTAVAVSEARYAEGAPSAYLARADLYVDALPAAALDDGPTLLVPSCGPLPQVVVDELERLDAERVVALGGPAAICEATLAAAGMAAGASRVQRIAGPTRIETAVAIAEMAFALVPPDDAGGAAPPADSFTTPVVSPSVVLATAGDFPDALAAGSLAAGVNGGRGPILLVPSCGELPAAVAAAIANLLPSQVLVLGGAQAVCDGMAEQARVVAQAAADAVFEEAGQVPAGGASEPLPPPKVVVDLLRLGGLNRLGTALAISQYRFPRGAVEAYLATSDQFPDALAAGKLRLGPILLVPDCGPLPAEILAELQRLNPTSVTALGGDDAVCADVLAQATER